MDNIIAVNNTATDDDNYKKKFGETIRRLRQQKGLSPKVFLESSVVPICSKRHLNRIETGESLPTVHTQNKLLAALRVTPLEFQYMLNGEDMLSFNNHFAEIWTLCNNNNYADAQKEFDELKKQDYCNINNPIIAQALLLLEGFFLVYVHKDIKVCLDKLYQALRLTRTNVLAKNNTPKCAVIAESIFTLNEYRILNLIAVALDESGQSKLITKMYKALCKSLNSKKIDSSISVKLLATIYYNLADALINENKYSEALEVCKEGISFCKNNSRFGRYAEILYCKAKVLICIGHIVSAESTFKKSYNVARDHGNEALASKIKSVIADKYNIHL